MPAISVMMPTYHNTREIALAASEHCLQTRQWIEHLTAETSVERTA